MIYLVVTESCEHCKIGYSNNPKRRFSQIQTHNREKLHLSGIIDGGLDREAEIHKMFAHENIGGEWFNLTTEMMDYFNDMYGIEFNHLRSAAHDKISITIDKESLNTIMFWSGHQGDTTNSYIRKIIKSHIDYRRSEFAKQKALAKSL